MAKPISSPPQKGKSRRTSRTFSVEGQLRAKLGTRGYAQLLDQLQATTRKPRRARGKRAAQ